MSIYVHLISNEDDHLLTSDLFTAITYCVTVFTGMDFKRSLGMIGLNSVFTGRSGQTSLSQCCKEEVQSINTFTRTTFGLIGT